MNRRNALEAAVKGAIVLAVAGGAGRAVAQTAKPIVLYCDLKVDPAREGEMLEHFHKRFKPGASKFEGFIDLKMLKLRTIIQGASLPEAINYRFQLTYANEELRQAWVASKVHADLWPGIEDTLLDKNFHVALFDEA